MRYLGDVPNSHYKIGLYAWNGKYIIKVETQFLEQVYKISEMDFVGDVEDLKAIVADTDFIVSVSEKFKLMSEDLNKVLVKLDL